MCLGIPGQVVERLEDQPHLAKVDVAGIKRKVNIGPVEKDGVKPGDWVLIHMGIDMSSMHGGASSTGWGTGWVGSGGISVLRRGVTRKMAGASPDGSYAEGGGFGMSETQTHPSRSSTS